MTGKHDLRSGADVRMHLSHAMIQRGRMFCVWEKKDPMNEGDTIIIAFETPEDFDIHLRTVYSSYGPVDVEVFEYATWDEGSGASFTAINRNRESDIASYIKGDANGPMMANEVVIYPDNFLGTIIDQISSLIWYNHPNDQYSSTELHLRANTRYGIVLTAKSAQNAGFLKLFWYEIRRRDT